MEHLLIYIAKVSVSAILFYLFIRILMERETQHEYIRGLWLGAMAASLVMPFIYFPVPELFPERTEAAGSVNMVVSAGEMEIIGAEEAAERTVDWARLVGWLYLAGAAAALAGYAVSHIRLASRTAGVPVTHEYDGLLSACAEASGCRRKVRLRVTDDSSVNPYSWMHDIIVSRRDIETDGRDILLHEMGHIRHAHSLDVIFTELFTVILWFNPVSWLMQYSLRQIHEYSADCTVLRSGADAREYQRLLIRKAAGTAFHSIANSFNHSNLKNRITMMLQNQTSKGAYAKSLSLLPVLACLLFVFSASRPAPEDKVSENLSSGDVLSSEIPVAVSDDEPDGDVVKYAAVEEKPEFEGKGPEAFTQWVCDNVRFPSSAIDRSINGRLVVQFVIGTDGRVGDVKVLRSVDPAIDQEAVRVISSSPAWKPGKVDGKAVRVAYVLPVYFEAKEDTAVKDDATSDLLTDKQSFLRWASSEILYPAAEKNVGKYGQVVASFNVNGSGSAENIRIMETPGEAFSEVIKNVIADSKWNPADHESSVVFSVAFSIVSEGQDGKLTFTNPEETKDCDISVMAFKDSNRAAVAVKQ